jgi:hypothetical protein
MKQPTPKILYSRPKNRGFTPFTLQKDCPMINKNLKIGEEKLKYLRREFL